MKGKNKVSGPFHSEVGSLLVNDIWYTLQGEGPDAGRPAIFIRLAKCNLRCYFCDTEFEQGRCSSLEELENSVRALLEEFNTDLVVITGGEPLLQNIIPAVHLFNSMGLSVSVETAGTVYVENLAKVFLPSRECYGNLIVCSPKTPLLNKQLLPLIGAFKYIIRHGEYSDTDGLPLKSTQIEGDDSVLYRPGTEPCTSGVPVYVQPMDEGSYFKYQQNMKAATNVALKYGYRLSLQVHKIVGVA